MENVKLGRFAIQISPYFLGPDGDLVKNFSISATAPDLRAGAAGGCARATPLPTYGQKGKGVSEVLAWPGSAGTCYLELRHLRPQLGAPPTKRPPCRLCGLPAGE